MLTTDFGDLHLKVIEFKQDNLLGIEMISGPFESARSVLDFERNIDGSTKLTVSSEIELDSSMVQDESEIAANLQKEYEFDYGRLKEMLESASVP